jgi:prepilin-type processing-associated H-X9-DG protein
MSIPDQLMAHEKQLQELGMDNLLFPKTILEINYKTVSVVFGINSECRVVDDPQHDPDLSDPDRLSAARIKDQNNLKQLGLVIKMFENEQRDYSPPGWLSVYPEYLADPLILTSPKDKPGTDSYLYLLPATNTNELIRQSQGDLEPAEMAAALSRIPAVLNKTDFPGPNPGRNVLYMDGHVEYDKRGGETWNTIIAPALSGQQ